MAADTEAGSQLQRDPGLSLAKVRGALFEAILVVATLSGILSLLALFAQISFDAFGLATTPLEWYLLYFGTLVAPTSAFTFYARRNPAVRTANAKSFAAVFGGLTLALTTYVVADSVSPYDMLLFALFGAIPPCLVYAYGRLTDDRTVTGPAIPVSIIVGIAAAAASYDVLRPLVGIAAEWITYFLFVTVPIAALVGVLADRRWSRQRGVEATGTVLGVALVIAIGALRTGIDPSFWLVLFSAAAVPAGYVVVNEASINRDGRIGVAGPYILLGGALLGAILERQLGVTGLESYLTPQLLLESWDGLNASNAGVYPQIVGSIIIVGFMSLLAFPVGIGAAVYLEEYAPESGWRGRLATLLEVNISNLAGVPSVVYGLLGLALFRNTLGFGTGVVVSAAGTLGLLILPIVVVSTQEALRSVPDSLRQASYGMGASRWQTLRNVVLPEAVPGTLTGTILALARAIGETAPLVIIAVATTSYSPPEGLFSSATALPLQIFAARSNFDAAFRHGVVPAAAVILLALMLVMNATAIVVRNRYSSEATNE